MTQQYDTEYLSQAIDEEIVLAKLDRNQRGRKPTTIWRDVPVHQVVAGKTPLGMYGGLHSADLPRYRRNPRDAGELCVKRGLNVKHDHDEHCVSASYGSSRRAVTEYYGMHPDVAAATMAAITRAAIQMLTEQRDEAVALNPTRSTPSRRPVRRRKPVPTQET